jgi:hypothetical protein
LRPIEEDELEEKMLALNNIVPLKLNTWATIDLIVPLSFYLTTAMKELEIEANYGVYLKN